MEGVVNGLKFSFTDSGKRSEPAIVFIHGFPFDSTTWQEQAALCESSFRTITYDQRGHGQTEAGQGHYMFEYFVDDLIGLLDLLNIKKAVLCGLSMGGYIALRAAERNPERIQALILCDTRSEADSEAAKLNRTADLRLIQEKGVEAFADKFLKKAFAASTFAKQPALVERIKRMISANPIAGIQGALIALATRTDTTPTLDKIQVPTLILVGEEDPITPPSAAVALHERIKNSRMTIISQAAHLSNLENPRAFNAPFVEFLKIIAI